MGAERCRAAASGFVATYAAGLRRDKMGLSPDRTAAALASLEAKADDQRGRLDPAASWHPI